jgi:hypothetical protein
MMTAQELLAMSDTDLRREVTKALEPMPWLHRTGQLDNHKPGSHCRKCDQKFPRHGYTRSGPMAYSAPGCPVPDAAEGSWADLAERLRVLPSVRRILYCAEKVRLAADVPTYAYSTAEHWGFEMSARDRVITCLLALQES